MANNDDKILNTEDILSLRLKIRFKNLTTNTEVPATEQVTIAELGEKSLVLNVPKNSCADKHNVMLDISEIERSDPKPKALFNATGKVQHIEPLDKRLRVEVELIQFEEKSWKAFLDTFQNRQEEIISFFERAKG